MGHKLERRSRQVFPEARRRACSGRGFAEPHQETRFQWVSCESRCSIWSGMTALQQREAMGSTSGKDVGSGRADETALGGALLFHQTRCLFLWVEGLEVITQLESSKSRIFFWPSDTSNVDPKKKKKKKGIVPFGQSTTIWCVHACACE